MYECLSALRQSGAASGTVEFLTARDLLTCGQKWLTTSTPSFTDCERQQAGCQHRLSFAQVEYCDLVVNANDQAPRGWRVVIAETKVLPVPFIEIVFRDHQGR